MQVELVWMKSTKYARSISLIEIILVYKINQYEWNQLNILDQLVLMKSTKYTRSIILNETN